MPKRPSRDQNPTCGWRRKSLQRRVFPPYGEFSVYSDLMSEFVCEFVILLAIVVSIAPKRVSGGTLICIGFLGDDRYRRFGMLEALTLRDARADNH